MGTEAVLHPWLWAGVLALGGGGSSSSICFLVSRHPVQRLPTGSRPPPPNTRFHMPSTCTQTDVGPSPLPSPAHGDWGSRPRSQTPLQTLAAAGKGSRGSAFLRSCALSKASGAPGERGAGSSTHTVHRCLMAALPRPPTPTFQASGDYIPTSVAWPNTATDTATSLLAVHTARGCLLLGPPPGRG